MSPIPRRRNKHDLDELGGMNVFIVMADGSIRTPALAGNILPGGTRSSIIQLLESQGAGNRRDDLPSSRS